MSATNYLVSDAQESLPLNPLRLYVRVPRREVVKVVPDEPYPYSIELIVVRVSLTIADVSSTNIRWYMPLARRS